MTIEELEARVKMLENQIQVMHDIEDIKRLQRAYGYYIEHWMSQELIDCFSDSTDVVWESNVGTLFGKDGIRRFFNRNHDQDGKISPEFLHQVMQLSGIVDVDPNGLTAKGRWYGWGATALPGAGGFTQTFINGVYECEYVKEDGKWKFLKLRWSKIFTAEPGKGWVNPERIAPIGSEKMDPPFEADLPRKFDTGYPSGYILPFHYKHPVTGKETTEGLNNASLEVLKNQK